MDTAEPKKRLRAFLKHATVRISSGKGHEFTHDSASTYSTDDDGRSQRSSISGKKDSKLRRLGRGIREWRSKRKRLHGDARPTMSHTLDGKSFSSSDASLSQETFEIEDLTDEDERVDDRVHDPIDDPVDAPVDGPEGHAAEAREWGRGESPEVKEPWKIVHKEVAVRQSTREQQVTRREVQSRTQSSREATAIGKAARKAGALEVDVDDLKCLIRLSDELDRWKVFRFSEYNCPEQNPTVSVGSRVLEQYYELRRLGTWVEFHSGLPGNEIADRMAVLSCWWLAKAAPYSAQGTDLAMPLKLLTFDEPWTRSRPHKGQPQYNKNMALRLLKDTKSVDVVLSTKANGPKLLGQASSRPGQRSCRSLQVHRPTTQVHRQLLHTASIRLAPGVGEAMVNPSVSFMRGGCRPKYDSTPGLQYQVVPRSIPQPPPTIPQPQPKVRTKKKGKKRLAVLERLLCTHCGEHGHLIHQCFDNFPEQKVAFPQRYAHYGGRMMLEKVSPGAFQNIARLHPQLMPQPIHGQDSRYMVGRVGISPYLTPKQCAVWAVRSIDQERRNLEEELDEIVSFNPIDLDEDVD